MEKGKDASMNICHIVGGGDFAPATLLQRLDKRFHAGDFCPSGGSSARDTRFFSPPGDWIIAADRGAKYLLEAGITPDLVIGDYDSLDAPPQTLVFPGKAPEIFTLPVEKDDTDLAAAAFLAVERGYRQIFLYGALGGNRFSHSLSAVQLLAALHDRGCRAAVLDERCTLLYLENASIFIPKEGFSAGEDGFLARLAYRPEKGRFFSLFVLTGDAAVTERGLKYPLDKARLTNRYPLGVSNEFTGEDAFVEVRQGGALLVLE